MRTMKDSGIEWIGEIPVNWETIKNKYLFSLRSGESISKEDLVEDGIYSVYGGGDKIGQYNRYNVENKTFLIGRVGARCGCITPINSLCWATDNALIADSPYINDYYIYAEIAANLNNLNESNAQPLITATKVLNVTIPNPTIEEQHSISAYLDRQCGLIDSVIEKTKASIEEYKKLRQAVITQAVTKGVRGDRPMKDSGIEWAGSIPVEWESVNPKVLFTQRKDKAHQGERQLTASQQYGVIYQDEYMEITGNKVVTVEKDFDILKHVEAGDFVISMRSFQGGLEYSTKTGSISSAYVMLIPNLEKVFPRFYRWLLKSAVYINALQSTSNMVRDGQAMRYSNFAQVRLYTVPLTEQEEIAAYLDQKCTEIDSLISKKEQFLTELEAYKKSLIYEYVTGKKEAPQA